MLKNHSNKRGKIMDKVAKNYRIQNKIKKQARAKINENPEQGFNY